MYEISDEIYEGTGFSEETIIIKDFTEPQLDEMILRSRKIILEKSI